MKVQELINKLNAVQDKSKNVVLCYEYGDLESGEPIGCAVGVVVNLISACTFPKSMADEAGLMLRNAISF